MAGIKLKLRLDEAFPRSAREIRLVLVIVAITIIIISCSSEKNTMDYTPSVKSDKENVSVLKSDIISGYIYTIIQKKCPGTTLSGSDKCYREGNLVTEKRINDFNEVFIDDKLNLSEKVYYTVGYNKLIHVVPIDLFTEYGIDLGSNYMNEAIFYFDSLMNKKECKSTKKTRNLEIKECKVDSERVIYLSFDKELAEFITSPYTGRANFGMPLKQYDDSLTVAWLVPKDSPVFQKIFSQ